MPHLHLADAHTRALAAMLRYLHGPVLFEAVGLPAAIHVPPSRLVIAAGGQSVPLDHERLKAIARLERVDVVGLSVDAWRELHPILFDIYLHNPDGVPHLPACRLFADTRAALFLPRLTTDDAVLIGAGGLVRTVLPLTPIVRLAGIARAQVELASVVWGGTVAAVAGRDLGGDR